ncbi:MAG: SpoIIE family protein phosphatase [Salinivirgaceae bacterium]|nr:SpoIIE family protein phosphatase [Salinivirgaceae bacterium]
MRLKLLLLFIIALSSFSEVTYAYQSSNTRDSIRVVLNDSELLHIDYEFQFFRNYNFNNDSIVIKHLNTALQQANKSENSTKIFQVYYLLGRYYLYKHSYDSAEYNLLKAKDFYKRNEEFIATLYFLSKIKIENNRYLEALEYLRQVKQSASENENVYVHAKVLLQEGFCYTQLYKYDIAENQYKKAYSLIESNALRKLYGDIFKHRGHLQYKQLNYLNALANFYKGLEFFDQDTVISNYAIIHFYIGKIFYYQENYTKALSYFNDAYMLYGEINDIKALGATQYEIALTNIKLNNFSESEQNLKRGRDFFNLIKNKKGNLSINLVYANLCLSQSLPDSALFYIKIITPSIEEINYEELKFDYLENYTNYYILKNNADSALYCAKMAQGLKNLSLTNQIDLENLLAMVYSFDGRYKKAFEHTSKATNLKDQLNKKINSYDIKVLQSELELSQTKVIIEHLNQERQIQNQTIVESQAVVEKQKILLYLGMAVLLLVLVSAFLLGAFLHQKRKDNKILSARNIQIAQHKEEIEQQSQHLQEINEELEELSIIARETDNGIKIMNGVGRILWVNEGYTKMHGYTIEELQGVENFDLLGEQANIDIQQLVNVWYGDKQPITFESLNKTKDKKDIWVQTTLTPILNQEGKIDKMIAIDSDITIIKKAEREIFIKNQDITSSISYAKRIQEAMMPPFNILSNKFKNSFCFYKPKSIVSGDFYWTTQRHDRLVIACADSTGHGVPGAFMSMIGMSFLNKIVNEKGFVSPDIILNRMRMNIINHLRQDGSESMAGDGMDMSIITIDKRNNKLEFSGAMNPVIIVRKGDLIELKPDRMPVGFFDNEDRPFTATTLNLEQNDTIFMYTDGFHDQFGGPRGSKLKAHRFKDLLKRTAEQPYHEQKEYIVSEFNTWKGKYPQVDDVLLIGISID